MTILNKLSVFLEAGQKAKAAGKLDIAHTSPDAAIEYMEQKGFDYKKEIPDFKRNFLLAKGEAKKGWMARKDMPVITSKDVQKFKDELKSKGIKAELGKIKVTDLDLIQKQIYFDTVINDIMAHGIEASLHHVTNKPFIISNDLHIIDGHHRFLTAVLLAPDMPVSTLKIDLSINDLLKAAHEFSESLGHEKNESFEDYRKNLWGQPVKTAPAMRKFSHDKYIDVNKDWK